MIIYDTIRYDTGSCENTIIHNIHIYLFIITKDKPNICIILKLVL